MSFPNIPNITPDISVDRDDVINLLLASIAMEELGLAHIINAEGEKIQYALGTLPGSPSGTSLEDILRVNDNVRDTMDVVIKKELLLDNKLKKIIDLIEFSGQTGSTGEGEPNLIFDQTAAAQDIYPPTGTSVILDTSPTPITNIEGQQVKIDSTAEFILTIPEGAGPSSVLFNYNLIRDDILIAQEVVLRNFTVEGEQRFVVPLTFVDSPPGPTATYQVEVEVLVVAGVESIITETRAITAVLFPAV